MCVPDADGKMLGERSERGGAGLSAMAAWLLSLTAGQAGEVRVALETPGGAVVESLSDTSALKLRRVQRLQRTQLHPIRVQLRHRLEPEPSQSGGQVESVVLRVP